MADKTYEIEVKTTSDTEGITSVKDALEETKSSVEEVNDALENVDTEALQSAFEEANEEVEELTETLAQIEMGEIEGDFDEVSSALEEATDKATELGNQLDAVNSTGMDGAKQSVDDLNDSLQQAEDSAEGLGSSIGLIDSAVMMDMANQVGALGSQAESMAQEMNTASISVGQLSTNVGMAEPQMVSLINNISNATFPQNEAMAYVKVLNQMGVEASKLGDSATNMDKINDATGMGYDKVMLLTQGLQSLGISADNLPASFNAIAYAEANVGGGAETLQQVLRRQAGTLNEYGMDIDATVLALSSLQRETGLTGMKLGSEFGSRLKECNGDLRALEQSLGLQAGALSNASQVTGEYAGQLQSLADEEAEHKTLIDQLNAGWEDMQLMLSPLLSPLMSFVGILGQFGQTAMAINSLLTLAETLGILKVATIPATISNWALAVSEWAVASPILIIVALILILIGVLAYLYFNNEQVRQAIDWLGQTIMQVAQIIWNTLVNAINTVISALQGFWSYLTNLGSNILGQVGITSDGILSTIVGFLAWWYTLPMQIGMVLIDIIGQALGFGDNFSQTLIEGVTNAVTGFIEWITQLPTAIEENLSQVVESTVNWLTSLWQSITELTLLIAEALAFPFVNIGQVVFDSLMTVWNVLNGILVSIWSSILNFGMMLQTTVITVLTFVTNAIRNAMAFFSTIPGLIAGYLSSVISRVISWGSSMASQFLSSASRSVSNFASQISQIPARLGAELSSALDKVNEWASTLPAKFWEAGVNAVKNFLSALGIASPGTMQRMLVWEVTEMGRRIPYESRNLLSNVEELGTNIVDSFGNPTLSIGSDITDTEFANSSLSSSNPTPINQTFNFEIGSIDNEERINEIVEIIRRELNWNNATAGRTV